MPVETKKSEPKPMPSPVPKAGKTAPLRKVEEEKMKIRVQPDFFFFCHPGRWDVVTDPDDKSKKFILPTLSRLRLIPGASGIGGDAANPTYLRLAISARESRGNILVERPFPCVAFGEQAEDYVQVFDGYFGMSYLDAWTRPFQIGATVNFKHDKKGRFEFQKAVQEKYLGAPDEFIVESLITDIRGQLRYQSDRSGPVARLFYDDMNAKLSFLEAYRG